MEFPHAKRRRIITAGGSLALSTLATGGSVVGALGAGAAGMGTLAGLSGCAGPAAEPGSIGETTRSAAHDHEQLPGFRKFIHTSGSIKHAVYASEGAPGPAVIIMHELTGLHKPTKELADWLVDMGYRVYLPLLFGPTMRRQPVRNVVRICVRREIYLFSRGRSSPVTDWLRSLAQLARAECGGTGIGVIGMCLTGGFVLPLVADEAVVAGVSAQPSLPILAPRSLGVNQSTLNAIAESQENELLSMRFVRDAISPLSRHMRIADAMCGSEVQRCGNYELLQVPGDGHSTLTGDYSLALSKGVDTRGKVLRLFNRKLRKQWLSSTSDPGQQE